MDNTWLGAERTEHPSEMCEEGKSRKHMQYECHHQIFNHQVTNDRI